MIEAPDPAAYHVGPNGRGDRIACHSTARENTMRLQVLSLVVLCCSMLGGPARALDPGKAFPDYVRHAWSVQQGMPQTSAAAIAQTPDGYIWVGTQGGLARFDGVGFTNFSPVNEPALPHPMVETLEVDADGALWIGTDRGMAVFRDGGFHPVPWRGEGVPPQVHGLHAARDGRVWAATLSGVAYVQDGGLHPLPGLAGANTVLSDEHGGLWAGGSEGVSRWDGQAWTPTRWQGGAAPSVSDLVQVGDEVWAATLTGFHVHGPSGWRPISGDAAHAMPLRFAYHDSDGNVWGGGHYGLLRVRPGGDVEVVASHRGNGLSNLASALEDREGNLWLGSLSKGLIRVRDGWTRVFSTSQGLHDPMVWSLAPAGDGSIWVGTNRGLSRLGSDGAFTDHAAQVSGATPALLAEPGGLWISTNPGLVHYQPDAGRVTVPDWARDLRFGILGFSRDAEGHLWMGGPNALLRWDGTTLERFDASRGLTGTLAEYRLVHLRDGRRVAVTNAGLFEFDGQAFVPAPESADLPDDVILHSFTELADGRLLLFDLNDFLLLRHEGRWHRVDQSSGLIPGTVHQVIERAGELWVSTVESVYRIRVEELTAFAEGRAERIHPEMLVSPRGTPGSGEQATCCNGAGLHDGFIAGDTMWLPTSDGVLAIDINDVVDNPHPPIVQLGRVQVGDQWRTLSAGAGATLDAHERDLTLAFDVLGFQDPDSNQARYRLTGYDRQWQAVAPLVREVRYTNLPPGEYAFEVMAANRSGVWTPSPARLEFSIRPYFHETLAFRLLLVVLVALLAYASHRYQQRRHHRHQAELERLVDQRTEALARSNEQLAETIGRLEEAIVTDPLTGLHNRRYLTGQLPADLNYYDRQLAGGPPRDEAVVFAMLDLDHFKRVNDEYGHAVGDRVLEETARRLKRFVRAGDYVVRWGGEEFLLVFRPMPCDQVPVVGERLRATVAETPFEIGDERGINLTASVGLSEYPRFRDGDRPLDWEAMIELADQALYYVKRNGRNGWAMFRPTATTPMDTLLADLQRDPQALLARGELALVGSVPAGS